jgi:hypothetical protein
VRSQFLVPSVAGSDVLCFLRRTLYVHLVVCSLLRFVSSSERVHLTCWFTPRGGCSLAPAAAWHKRELKHAPAVGRLRLGHSTWCATDLSYCAASRR